MRDFVLVFEEPVDAWFIAHCFVDGLGHRFSMDVKQGLVIEVVFCRNTRV